MCGNVCVACLDTKRMSGNDQESVTMTTATVRIDGMGCGHCVDAVRRELASLPGVRVDSVSIGEAQVSFDEKAASRQDIERAIRKAGYTPAPA